MLDKNISIFISNQFPDNFRKDGELLVRFIELYYQWMEEVGNVTDVTRKITDYTNPDNVPDQFFDFLRDEFMRDIPKNLVVDQKILLKNILDFYKSRGTESSYRLLFRILFNVEINFYYPGTDILRASDGRWTVERYLVVEDIDTSIDLLLIAQVKGVNSDAIARVERLEQVYINNIIQNRLYLAAVFGTFQPNEDIIEIDTSKIVCRSKSTLVIEDGKYIGTFGQLSSDKKLQDNFYYQEYSYEIQSPIDTLKYESIVKGLVHPAGTKMFGKYLNNFDIDVGADGYFDVKFGNITILFGVDDGHSIIIDNSDISIVESEISYTNSICDFDRSETIGTGTVSINDGLIDDFASFTIGSFGETPIGLIGTQQLLVGTGTFFATEIAQMDGPIPGEIPAEISILDIGNNYFGNYYTIDTTYSDVFLSINSNYFFPSVTTEQYSLLRNFSGNKIEMDNAKSVNGTGTVTWDSINNEILGTGSMFTSEVNIGDIIVIPSIGDGFFVTSIVDDETIGILASTGIYPVVDEDYIVLKY